MLRRLEIVEKAEVEEGTMKKVEGGTRSGSRTGQHHPPPSIPPLAPTSYPLYPRLLLYILPHTRWCFFSCSHCQARPIRQFVISELVFGWWCDLDLDWARFPRIIDDDGLFSKKNWAPVLLKDPGKAILGWPALWDLPRLFATPAKKHFSVWKRLKIRNGLDMQYIRGLFATPEKTL